MKCPYCDREMQVGYLHNGDQPLQWLPEDAKPSALAYKATTAAVPLDNTLKLSGYRAPAHYCPSCKIVLAKTK